MNSNKEEKLTKTFVIISIKKNVLVFMVYVSAVRVTHSVNTNVQADMILFWIYSSQKTYHQI